MPYQGMASAWRNLLLFSGLQKYTGATQEYAVSKESPLWVIKARVLGVLVKKKRYRSRNICPINQLLLYCTFFFNIKD